MASKQRGATLDGLIAAAEASGLVEIVIGIDEARAIQNALHAYAEHRAARLTDRKGRIDRSMKRLAARSAR